MNDKQKYYIKLFLKLTFSVCLMIIIFKHFDINIKELFVKISNFKYLLLALIMPIVVTTALSANRWKSFLLMIGINESFFNLYKIILISVFCGMALPSAQGADFFRIYNIERKHSDYRGIVGSTVFVERIFGLICLMCIATIAWVVCGSEVSFLPILILMLIVFLSVFFIINDCCYKFFMGVLNSTRFAPKIFEYIKKLYSSLHSFPFSKGVIWSVLLILLLQLSNIIVVYLLFDACGYHVDFVYHLCYQPIISVITMIPITFGGIGIREGGFVYLYSQLGVPVEILVAVSILYYFAITLFPSIFGGFLYLCDIFRVSKKA